MVMVTVLLVLKVEITNKHVLKLGCLELGLTGLQIKT